MSRVHRLRATDRIFFVTVNLRRALPALSDAEFASILASFEESRRRLGFLLCGYVLMPDHWHALLWPRYPLTISRLVQDIKYVSSCRLNRQRRSEEPTTRQNPRRGYPLETTGQETVLRLAMNRRKLKKWKRRQAGPSNFKKGRTKPECC